MGDQADYEIHRGMWEPTEEDDAPWATMPDEPPDDGYRRGEELGCPDCASGEPHVCPFLMADAMPEPRRTWALGHMREQLA